MIRQDIISLVKENAQSICATSRPYLLSVDVDEHYSKEINVDFLEEYGNFLDSVRHAFNIVHICHNHKHADLKQRPETGKTFQCKQDGQYNSLFPVTKPKTGEYIIGKKGFDAFSETDLTEKIVKHRNVFIIGAYGQYGADKSDKNRLLCIDNTILGGLTNGFNMIAIADMIYVRYARRNYKDYGRIPIINSDGILEALNINI